jgi:hypothetical protein
MNKTGSLLLIFVFDKTVKRVVLDPHKELVDANYDNNAVFGTAAFEKIEITTQNAKFLQILCKRRKMQKN